MAITVLNAPPQPADVSAAALGWTDAKDYAAGDGVADDTLGLLAAIAATPEGGTLYLPLGEYKITAPLVIDKAMTLRGAGCHELWGSVTDDGLSCTVPIQDPFIAGAVIVPSTGGQNGINVTVAGLAVHLADFGVRFAAGIRWSNTGHGVQLRPPTVTGGRDNGVQAGTIENVTVHGHDGNHYAFDVYNPIMDTWRHIRGYGGGLLRIENTSGTVAFDGFPINYGNVMVDHPYGVLMCAGTAHGISLVATSGALNLIQWNRPQIWARGTDTDAFFGTTGPAAPQKMMKLTNAANIRRMSFIQPDFETNANLDMEWPTRGAFIDPAGNISGPGGQFAIFRPAEFTFGDRSQSRSLNWNLDTHVVAPTGSTEEWGIYDEASQKYLLSAGVGPDLGASYVRRGATGARPTSPAEGAMFYDTTIHKLITWDGSNWKAPTLATV